MSITLERIAPHFLRWRRHIVAAGGGLIGLALLLSGQTTAMDRQLRMMRDGIRSHSASGQVAIVEIDARSLRTLDKWPWPRGIHALIIDKLREGRARSIAFDVDFSSRSTAAEDMKLAAALKRADGAVSLPTIRQNETENSSNYIDSQPLDIFRDNAFLSAVTVVPDEDGAIRSMPTAIETFGTPRPSLSSTVAERNAEVGRFFDIDYAIEPDTIPRLSALDLVTGKVPAAAIAGRRFIVGMTAVEVGDRYAVPRFGVVPGVVVQALGAETLMEGSVPRTISGIFLLILAQLLAIVAIARKKRVTRAALLIGAAMAAFALPIATEELFAISMSVAPALAAVFSVMALAGGALVIERFLQKALHDSSSGLPNLVALEIAAARQPDPAVVIARIDRLATIAAGLGTEGAALLVQRIAERLRLAGFGEIYHVEAGSLAWLEVTAEAESLDERLQAVLLLMRSPIECGRPVDVSLSFGVATGCEVRQRVANAGAAAAQAARAGERWRWFADADGAEIDWQLSLLGELDSAMASGQLWNAYQPKLDIASGEIVGVEALVRWMHPVRGPMGPDTFIPVIEDAGRARDLTNHVFCRALEDALAWDRAGLQITIAVNVSATLLRDHEFIEMIGQLLESHELPSERITIEVTESAAMDRPEQAIAALGSWRALGVGISIDDYGTGQSSLGYLQKLPASELKIDKSFVATIASDSRNAIMVRSTIDLAHQLGMKVVAEGVEDSHCLDLLAKMGCDTAQGYYISRPIAPDQLVSFVAARPGLVRKAA